MLPWRQISIKKMVGGISPRSEGLMPSEYIEIRKEIAQKGGDAMMVLEIIGAAAAVITIFSAGVAVGKFLSCNQKDRPQPGKLGDLDD